MALLCSHVPCACVCSLLSSGCWSAWRSLSLVWDTIPRTGLMASAMTQPVGPASSPPAIAARIADSFHSRIRSTSVDPVSAISRPTMATSPVTVDTPAAAKTGPKRLIGFRNGTTDSPCTRNTTRAIASRSRRTDRMNEPMRETYTPRRRPL